MKEVATKADLWASEMCAADRRGLRRLKCHGCTS